MTDAPTRADVRPPEGRVVAGKYELEEQIGAGGMGSVWRAIHIVLGTELAIKFLHGKVARDEVSRARFEREAKLAARLGEKCVNIGRVVDVGVDESDVPYIVMELLRGEDLQQRLARDASLPIPLVRDIATQLCRALATAHEAGVVHRDLKPANVFLCAAGTRGSSELLVKLLDFGVAKAGDGTGGATTNGAVIGTPQFMSPEQLQASANVDGRTDLWAVGAVVYRVLVGREAFTGDTLEELAMRVMFSPHVPPSAVDPRLGPEVDAFMERALAKSPARRFQSAQELAAALDRALDSTRTSADVVTARDAETFELPIVRTKGLVGIAAGVGGLVVIGSLVALGLGFSGAPSPHDDARATATTPLATASLAEAAPPMEAATSLAGSSRPATSALPPPVTSTVPRAPAALQAAGRPTSSAAPMRATPPRGPGLEGKSAASWKDGNQM